MTNRPEYRQPDPKAAEHLSTLAPGYLIIKMAHGLVGMLGAGDSNVQIPDKAEAPVLHDILPATRFHTLSAAVQKTLAHNHAEPGSESPEVYDRAERLLGYIMHTTVAMGVPADFPETSSRNHEKEMPVSVAELLFITSETMMQLEWDGYEDEIESLPAQLVVHDDTAAATKLLAERYVTEALLQDLGPSA